MVARQVETQESPDFLFVNHHPIVVAQIYILRSLAGIAEVILCQEEDPGSARTAVQHVQQAREKE